MSNDARQRRLLSYRSLLSEEEEQEEGGFNLTTSTLTRTHAHTAQSYNLHTDGGKTFLSS
jgi:hypothetical protein